MLQVKEDQVSQPTIFESFLFFALFSGPPRLRSRDPLASFAGIIDWAVILNVVVWVIGALWVFHKLNGYYMFNKSELHFGLFQKLALLCVIAFSLSILKSAMPVLTAYKSFQILVMVLFTFIWLSQFGPDSTIHHIFYSIVMLCILIIIFALFLPKLVFSGQRLMGGVVTSTGYVASMGLILLLSYPIILSRSVFTLLLCIFIILLIISLTRSAYAATFLFLILTIIRYPKVNALRRLLLIALLSVIIMFAFHFTSQVEKWIIREPQSIESLSGRIPLWQYTISETLKWSPWLGLGLYANRPIVLRVNPHLGTSHSALVEVVSGTGIVGLVAFSLLFLSLGILSTRLYVSQGKRPEVFALVSIMGCAIIIGLVSEEMIIASPTAFVFWALCSLLPAASERCEAFSDFGTSDPLSQSETE
jgi:O-antigen ligase